MTGKDFGSAAPKYKQDIIGIAPSAIGWVIHAWGANRHTWNGNADCCRSFDEQSLDVAGRNVTLNRIAGDACRMTGAQFAGYAQVFASSGIAFIVRFDFESVLLEVSDPATTAVATRAFPNLDFG